MNADTTPPLSARRRLLFAFLTMLVSLAITLAAGELLVRWLDPQATMIPRSHFSAAYGLEFTRTA